MTAAKQPPQPPVDPVHASSCDPLQFPRGVVLGTTHRMPAAAITVLQNIDIILRAKNRGHHGVCAACRPEFESWARLMATQQLLRLPRLHATDLSRVHLAPGPNCEPVVIKAFCADIPEHSLEREAAALLQARTLGRVRAAVWPPGDLRLMPSIHT